MTPPTGLPIIGTPVQLVRVASGAQPHAAIICGFDQNPSLVNLACFDESGNPYPKRTVKYVMPGDPVPTNDHCTPLPTGGPSAAQTSKRP